MQRAASRRHRNPESQQGRDEEPASSRERLERVGNYVIGKEIGRGSFATVYKGHNHRTNEPIAIKVVSRSKLTPKLLENLEGEISILKAISHRNIVELDDCIKNEHHIYLIMAFCSGGDLSVYIKKRGQLPTLDYPKLLPNGTADPSQMEFWPHPNEGGLDPRVTRCFLGQLAEAVKFLRARDLIHRDIKPQNLLLHPPTSADYAIGHPYGIPVLKVGDFGFARILPAATMAETLCGSPLYMAPEILRYEKYDPKVDLWSIGAVLYEMAVGRPPFRAQNHVELLRKIEKGEDRITFPERKSSDGDATKDPLPVDQDIKELICRLLKKDPKNRMPFEEFFESRVWQGYLTTPATGAEQRNGPTRSLSGRRISQVGQSSGGPVQQERRQPSQPRYVVSTRAPQPAEEVKRASPRQSSPRILPLSAPRTSNSPTVSSPTATSQEVQSPLNRPPSNVRRYSTLDRRSSQERFAAQDYRSPPLLPSGTNSPIDKDGGQTPLDTSRASIRVGSANLQESEYVVVEKKTVEVNALADEMDAAAKKSGGGLVRRRSSRGLILARPIQGTPRDPIGSESSPVSYSPPFLSSTPPFALPPGSHPSRPPSINSFSSSPSNVRTGPVVVLNPRSNAIATYGGGGLTYHQAIQDGGNAFTESSPSGSSAWARAMGMAGLKFFGSPVTALSHLSRRPWRQQRLRLSTKPEKTTEDMLLTRLEELAQKAHVLSEFADSKVAHIMIPSKMTPSGGLFNAPASGNSPTFPNSQSSFSPQLALSRKRSSSGSNSSAELSHARVGALYAEAMVLYVKTLALLQQGVEEARSHWEGQSDSPDGPKTSIEFNETVQWFRHRFNDCFDKAEWTKARAPEEIPESASYFEKLIYDKAIEISRTAAVTELVGEDLISSESGYEAALWLLRAVLDPLLHDGYDISAEDRQMIEQIIGSVQTRLEALRRKMSLTKPVQ